MDQFSVIFYSKVLIKKLYFHRLADFKTGSKMASIKYSETNPNETLPILFAKGLALHDEICSDEGDQRSIDFQNKVQKGIMILEDATRMVSILDLFSRNENVSDLPTESLKFFLLPVLLGLIYSKRFMYSYNACIHF